MFVVANQCIRALLVCSTKEKIFYKNKALSENVVEGFFFIKKFEFAKQFEIPT